MPAIQGFPLLTEVNQTREGLFTYSYQDRLSVDTTAAWFGHKVLSFACIPCNAVAIGVGLTGMVATAATLGTLKVAVYAGTLGNVKPSFPTGFLWFNERTAKAACDCCVNAYELIYDLGHLFYQGFRLVEWIAKKIHLGGFVKKALKLIADTFEVIARKVLLPVVEFAAKRIQAGLEKAMESEVRCEMDEDIPFFKPMNEVAKETRINMQSQDRLLSTILKHYAISMVSIPVNAVAATVFTATSIILSAAFVGKASLYAATNVHIPIPTYVEHSLKATASTGYNTIADVATNVADPFVLIYKTAYALRLNRVMATALDVIFYIPQAILS